MADEVPVKKRKLFDFPDSTVDKMIEGLDCLFRPDYAIFPLKISNTNGDYAVHFPRASCSSERYTQKFCFASFFQSTIKTAAESLMKDATYMSELDRGLIQCLMTVLEKSVDIAQRLHQMNNKKFETNYTKQLAHHLSVPLSLYKDLHDEYLQLPILYIAQLLQQMNNKKLETDYTKKLAHHLLVPLSLYKDYTMNSNSYRYFINCECCNETIKGNFGDTSFGNERVWHGSPDILIGKKPDCIVPVVVSIDEEEEETEEEEAYPISSLEHCRHQLVGKKPDCIVPVIVNIDDEEEEQTEEEEEQTEKEEETEEEEAYPISTLEHCRHQLIAETIVFGLLRLKMNYLDRNSLTPTIAISERDVKICFYDARHDFLLESPTLPLFTDDGKDLQVGTVLALWLTTNYHVTCTGLTEAVVYTGFTSDFMKDFSDEVKERYTKELRFSNCEKKINVYEANKWIYSRSIRCADGLSKPLEKGFDCITNQHCDLIKAESRKVTLEKRKKLYS